MVGVGQRHELGRGPDGVDYAPGPSTKLGWARGRISLDKGKNPPSIDFNPSKQNVAINRKELKMKRVKTPVHCEKVCMVIFASFLMFFGVGTVAKADDYPTKPITLTVPMAPGGGSDTIVRMVAPGMEKILKTPIIIQYKTGGGGTIAYSWLSREKPDGYSIGCYAGSFFLQQYSKKDGAKINGFDFIGTYGLTDSSVAVLSSSPFKTLKDLLDYARKNPGIVTISNSGMGADRHLPAAGIEKMAGVKFTHVPMDGESSALMAMLGGHVTAVLVSTGIVAEHVKSGKARILSVNSEKRMEMFPDVPTLKEQGIDFEYVSSVGLFGPKGIPENRIKMLSDALVISAQSEQFKSMMSQMGFRPVNYDYKQVVKLANDEDLQKKNLLKLVGLYVE